jgi:Fe-S cluster assembly protein SufD
MGATSETTTGLEGVRTLAAAHREPAWLSERRSQAWQRLMETPPPDRAAHLWRYSDPRWFERDLPAATSAAGAGRAPSVPGALREALERGELLAVACVGAGGTQILLGEAARAAGVVLLDLHAAASDAVYGERVRQHLGRLVDTGTGRLEARHAALWHGGIFLYVPRRAELGAPIHVVMQSEASAAVELPRLLAVVEDTAQVTLVEEHADRTRTDAGHAANASMEVQAGPLTVAVSEIVAGAGSQVRYVLAQRLSASAVLHGTQRVELGRDARVQTVLAAVGAWRSKLDLGVLLRGQGASSELAGFLFGSGRQHFDHHTELLHAAPHGSSTIDFKTVLTGKARSAYTGRIRIEHGAPYSQAYQENRNLLLSDDARAESLPELEISIDEVQCKHGATVGPVRPDELFYLMSRGIPRRDAVRQIVEGFLESVLVRVPEEFAGPLRHDVEARLQAV